MTAACCGGIGLCIDVLCESRKNLLVPSPGFGLYKCLCEARGAKISLYKLLVKPSLVSMLREREREREREKERKKERDLREKIFISYAA